MTAVRKDEFLYTADEYLALEAESDVRHELVAGRLFAMAGESRRHNEIAGAAYAALRSHLRGKPCRVYMENVKARVHFQSMDLFYYPDVMVACDERDTSTHWIQFPKLIIEVMSESTRTTDTRDKLISYLQTDSVEEYVMIEQAEPSITILRREDGWQPETTKDLAASVEFRSVGLTVAMRDLYGEAT